MLSSTQCRAIESPSASEPFPFLRLPAELRRLVWKFTLPGSQFHKVVMRRCGPRMPDLRAFAHCVQSPETPVALRICKESRAVAQETLTQFPRCQETGFSNLSYFDQKTDILFVDPTFPGDTWDAPWVNFTKLPFNARFLDYSIDRYPNDWLQNILKMFLRRPLVSQIYFTDLEVDEETKLISQARWLLQDISSPFMSNRPRNTKCISISDLEVADDTERTVKRLSNITSRLSAELKDFNFKVNLASAKVCCESHSVR